MATVRVSAAFITTDSAPATPAMVPTWRQADGIGGIRCRAIRSTAPKLESARLMTSTVATVTVDS